MSDDIYRPDGSRQVRTTSNGTAVVRNAPTDCVLSGLPLLDSEAFDMRRPINVKNAYVSVVAVQDLAQQTGMVHRAAHEQAVADLRAEFAERVSDVEARENVLASLSADLEQAEQQAAKERSALEQAEQQISDLKSNVRTLSTTNVSLRLSAEQAEQARDEAKTELARTIKRESAAPVAPSVKRGPGRPKAA